MTKKKPKRRRRLTNGQLLKDRLSTAFIIRMEPEINAKVFESSHWQGMARHLGEELIALAKGAAECRVHQDCVEGACPRCSGVWPS
jgi:hypothetical protein